MDRRSFLRLLGVGGGAALSTTALAHLPAGFEAIDVRVPHPFAKLVIGQLKYFKRAVNLPDGWLWCEGQDISRTNYAELFQVLGINCGEGDGVNTFGLPPLMLPYEWPPVPLRDSPLELQAPLPAAAGGSFIGTPTGGDNGAQTIYGDPDTPTFTMIQDPTRVIPGTERLVRFTMDANGDMVPEELGLAIYAGT